MGVIMHKNVSYGGGSVVEPNPQESATEQLETLGIDGDVYEVTDANAIHTSDVGVANGVAELDANGFVPSSQLPSYVDDVLEYASRSAFPATGETGKIYVALDTNLTYRWGGSDYVEISPSLALGETSSTAYRGDRGKIAYDHSQSDHSGIKPAFTEASTRANIASGETIATILGKIKKFFSDLKTVAFTGAYSDLSGTPTIPTVNDATLTIQKNGTNVQTFSANQSENATANIECATPSDVEGSKVVTGNPLTITDAAGIKAEKIEIGFEPKQDLHGYDKPWVGGAGKNKLPITVAGIKAANSGATWNGNVGNLNGMTFTINTDSDGNFTGLKCAGPSNGCTFVLFDGSVTVQSGCKYNLSANRNNNTFDSSVMNGSTSIGYISGNTASTADVTLSDTTVTKVTLYFNRNYTDTLTLYPMIRNSADSATFEPPSNISTITGYTSLSADECGKNLFDKSNVRWNYLHDGTTEIYSYGKCYSHLMPVEGNTDYYFKNVLGGGSFLSALFYDEYGNFIEQKSLSGSGTQSGTLKSSANAKFVRTNSNTSDLDTTQVEKGTAFSSYEAYKHKNVTIQLGQTLYGGKLTILQDGSADVDVDTGFDVYTGENTENWVFSYQNSYYQAARENTAMKNSLDAMTNEFENIAVSDRGTKNGFITYSDTTIRVALLPSFGITSVAQWQAFLASHNLQVAYKLATPFTIHLSPVETLNLLQGINNAWTDGTTLSLTYQPDNAIGQAKGTAQEAMAIANGLKPLYSTGSVGSGKTGVQKIAQITLSEVGTYYITGWAKFTGGGKKAVQLWCAGTLGESWEDSTIATGEPKTFSTFAIYTSTVANEDVKVNSYTVSASNAVTGGIVAFKIA